MNDQNKTDQNTTDQTEDAKHPISSGIAPGPGEHLADAAVAASAGSQPSTATSTGADGAHPSQSSPYRSTTATRNDSVGSQQGGYTSGTTPRRAQNQSGRSRGTFVAGAVVAGFLLQRFLKSSSAQKSGQRYSTYRSDTSGTGDGANASFDSERKYGVDTAYAPGTSYGADTGTTSRITERLKQASGNARSKLQATTADAKARLNDVGQVTKTQYYRAKERVGTVQEEQPLLIGALGIAIGAGLGALLATTRRENELLGGLRDNLVGKAKETAMNQVQTVKESAQRFAEITKQEAQRKKDELAAAASQPGAKSNDNVGSKTATAAGQGLR
jgi:hypothetical protein